VTTVEGRLDAWSSTDALVAGNAAAEEWASLHWWLVLAGRRVNVKDLWIALIALIAPIALIALIALANALSVVTRDQY